MHQDEAFDLAQAKLIVTLTDWPSQGESSNWVFGRSTCSIELAGVIQNLMQMNVSQNMAPRRQPELEPLFLGALEQGNRNTT